MVRSEGLSLNPNEPQTASEIIEVDELFNTLAQWDDYLKKEVPLFQGGPR